MSSTSATSISGLWDGDEGGEILCAEGGVSFFDGSTSLELASSLLSLSGPRRVSPHRTVGITGEARLGGSLTLIVTLLGVPSRAGIELFSKMALADAVAPGGVVCAVPES